MPEAETLYEMKIAQYIQCYKKKHHGRTPEQIATQQSQPLAYAQRVAEIADSVEQIIREAGGLRTFKAAFAELSQIRARDMSILRDLSRRAGTYETIEDIAKRYGLSDVQITNIKNSVLIPLAINISGRAKRCAKKRKQADILARTGRADNKPRFNGILSHDMQKTEDYTNQPKTVA